MANLFVMGFSVDAEAVEAILKDADTHIGILADTNLNLFAENTTLRASVAELGKRNETQRESIVHLLGSLSTANADTAALEDILKGRNGEIARLKETVDRLTDDLAEAYHPEFGTVPYLQARVAELEKRVAELTPPEQRNPADRLFEFKGPVQKLVHDLTGIKVYQVPDHLMPPGVDAFAFPAPLFIPFPASAKQAFVVGADFADIEKRVLASTMDKQVDDLTSALIFGGLTGRVPADQPNPVSTPQAAPEPIAGKLHRTLEVDIELDMAKVTEDLHKFREDTLFKFMDKVLDEVEASGVPKDQVPYLDDFLAVAHRALDGLLSAFILHGNPAVGHAEEDLEEFGKVSVTFYARP